MTLWIYLMKFGLRCADQWYLIIIVDIYNTLRIETEPLLNFFLNVEDFPFPNTILNNTQFLTNSTVSAHLLWTFYFFFLFTSSLSFFFLFIPFHFGGESEGRRCFWRDRVLYEFDWSFDLSELAIKFAFKKSNLFKWQTFYLCYFYDSSTVNHKPGNIFSDLYGLLRLLHLLFVRHR